MEFEKFDTSKEKVHISLSHEEVDEITVALRGIHGQAELVEQFEALPAKVQRSKAQEADNLEQVLKESDARRASAKTKLYLKKRAVERYGSKLELQPRFKGSKPSDSPLELSERPPRRKRVTVADVIGPEETREVIEERRDSMDAARKYAPRQRRRTRADSLMSKEENKKLLEDLKADRARRVESRQKRKPAKPVRLKK